MSTTNCVMSIATTSDPVKTDVISPLFYQKQILYIIVLQTVRIVLLFGRYLIFHNQKSTSG